jgi:ABC-type multidrug transport system fused ATPase/permease subunit
MQQMHNETPREPDDAMDTMLRSELRWEAPSELSSRLLSLVPGTIGMSFAAPARPKTWYSALVLVLTMLAVGVSFAVAWEVYSVLGAELGLAAAWVELQAAFAAGVQQLTETLPAMGYAFALIEGVREQLHWILVAIILWLALDGSSPRMARRSRAA